MATLPEPKAWLWPGTRLRIATVLVDADTPLAGSEIAQILDVHTSNVNRELVALEQAHLVTVQPPDPADAPAPGRPSRYWRLSTEQRRIAEGVLTPNPTPRRPQHTSRAARTTRQERQRPSVGGRHNTQREDPSRSVHAGRGDELVFADVSGDQVVDLMALLAKRQAHTPLRWAALCGDELLMAFDGPAGPTAALDLMAALKVGGSKGLRRATVARVWPGDEFLAQARASAGGDDGAGSATEGRPDGSRATPRVEPEAPAEPRARGEGQGNGTQE